MIVRHRCRDRPCVCPKYLVSVRGRWHNGLRRVKPTDKLLKNGRKQPGNNNIIEERSMGGLMTDWDSNEISTVSND